MLETRRMVIEERDIFLLITGVISIGKPREVVTEFNGVGGLK